MSYKRHYTTIKILTSLLTKITSKTFNQNNMNNNKNNLDIGNC